MSICISFCLFVHSNSAFSSCWSQYVYTTQTTRFFHVLYVVNFSVLILLVDTSNVDGHWKRYVHNEELYEIHGSIDYWQCSQPCCRRLWKPPKGFMFEINEETMIAPLKEAPLPELISDGEPLVDEMIAPHFASNRPTCPFCGRPARPYVSVYCD